jgi:hypothetical protein
LCLAAIESTSGYHVDTVLCDKRGVLSAFLGVFGWERK